MLTRLLRVNMKVPPSPLMMGDAEFPSDAYTCFSMTELDCTLRIWLEKFSKITLVASMGLEAQLMTTWLEVWTFLNEESLRVMVPN